ncbi:MAG: preprotein translocase subunit SecG [Oscillospiraceae bacterium]|nr:preprotein translocase subunit SecG [Oscillospiraceae bacterium]
MDKLTLVTMIVQVVCAVVLIVVIALQSGKSAGLSGAISGGSSENFLTKGKNRTVDAKLASVTKWIAGLFMLLTFILNLL